MEDNLEKHRKVHEIFSEVEDLLYDQKNKLEQEVLNNFRTLATIEADMDKIRSVLLNSEMKVVQELQKESEKETGICECGKILKNDLSLHKKECSISSVPKEDNYQIPIEKRIGCDQFCCHKPNCKSPSCSYPKGHKPNHSSQEIPDCKEPEGIISVIENPSKKSASGLDIYDKSTHSTETPEEKEEIENVEHVKESDWSKAEKVKKHSRKLRFKYPPQMAEFVRKNMDSYRNRDLAELIDKKFDININDNRLASYMRHHELFRDKLKFDKIKYVSKPRESKFPDGMREFIEENMQENKNPVLCERINEKFNIEITIEQVKSFMRVRGIKRTKKGTQEEIEESLVKDNELETASTESICQNCDESEENCTCEESGTASTESYCEECEETEENCTCEESGEEVEEGSSIPEPKPIERDPLDLTINGEKVPRDVMEYISRRRKQDPLQLRDELIIIFKTNYKMSELKSMQSQFNKELKTLPPSDY